MKFMSVTLIHEYFINPLRSAQKMGALIITTLWPNHAKYCIGLIILELGISLLPVLQVYLVQRNIDSILLFLQDQTSSRNFHFMIFWFSLQGLCFILHYSFTSLANFSREYLSNHFSLLIQENICRKKYSLDLSYLETPEYHNLIGRAQNGAVSKAMFSMNELMQFSRTLITLTTFLIFLLYMHWIFCVLGFLITLPSLCVGRHSANLEYEQEVRLQEISRMSSEYSNIVTSQYGAKEIRHRNFGDFVINKWKVLQTLIVFENLRLKKKIVGYLIVMNLVQNLAGILSIIFLIYWGARTIPDFTIGQASMYVTAFTSMQTGIFNLFNSFNNLYEYGLYFADYLKFMDMKPRITFIEKRERNVEPVRMISWDNVSFKYPNTDTYIFNNINFTMQPGKIIVVIGENGSGKSTFVKLMARLYDPTHGRIVINGRDLRSFSKSEIRSYLSVMFQDYAKYPVSLHENIGFGDMDKYGQWEEIKKYSEISGVSKFVMKLPYGYETCMSRAYTDGYEISGGQWQRIAIARTLLPDSEIMIFDEPIAYIDHDFRLFFIDYLQHESQKRTMIVITHDPVLRSCADEIYLFTKQGLVIEKNVKENRKIRLNTEMSTFD